MGNPEEVLNAIGKYGSIKKLDEQLLAGQRRLADEESRIEERIDEREQMIRQAEERGWSTRDRLSQLDQEADAKAELLRRGR